MKVLYLTQWFEPEPTMKGLSFVKALRDRGFDCDVATGFPNYPVGKIYSGYDGRFFSREQVEGVQVDRLPLFPSHSRSSVGRALNYLSFFLSALAYLLVRGRRYDAILVYHPPVMPAFAAALLGGWLRRPFVMDIQDLWPDSVASSGMAAAGALARALNWICDFTYRRAALISVQSAGFRAELERRGVPAEKLRLIYNWADEGAAINASDPTPGPSPGTGETFTFIYAGNLGAAQDLGCLIDAAELAAAQEPRIRLQLIGDGLESTRLKTRAGASNGVTSVLPAVPKAGIGAVLARADVLVAHLKPTPLYDMTIPSKVPFYMAVGRPVLAAIGGEAGEIVNASRSGLAARPGDARAISDAMLTLCRSSNADLSRMGAIARATYTERFAFQIGLDATAALLNELDRKDGRP